MRKNTHTAFSISVTHNSERFIQAKQTYPSTFKIKKKKSGGGGGKGLYRLFVGLPPILVCYVPLVISVLINLLSPLSKIMEFFQVFSSVGCVLSTKLGSRSCSQQEQGQAFPPETDEGN